MAILITGASGFCAGHLLKHLRSVSSQDIIGISKSPWTHSVELWDEFVQVDVRDMAELHAVVKRTRPQDIFHLAALSKGSTTDICAVNVAGTRNLLDVVLACGNKARLLVVGSAAEYGAATIAEMPLRETSPRKPITDYGRSKRAATVAARLAHRRRGTLVVEARPFNLVGPGIPPSLVVGALIERLLHIRAGGEKVLRVGNLDAQRDFVAVEDAVDAYVRLLNVEAWGEVVNICSGVPTEIRSVVNTLREMSDISADVVTDPSLLNLAGPDISYGSNAKARELIGFAPRIDLRTSLDSAWRAAESNCA